MVLIEEGAKKLSLEEKLLLVVLKSQIGKVIGLCNTAMTAVILFAISFSYREYYAAAREAEVNLK